MTAQYRPYRDEDSPESELNGWTEHEPAIQIYENTTENVPRKKKLFPTKVLISFLLMYGVFFFAFGYFFYAVRRQCVYHPPLTLVEKYIKTARIHARNEVSANQLKTFYNHFAKRTNSATADEDYRSYSNIHDILKEHKFDRVSFKNYTVLLSMPDKTRPNYVSLENDRGDVHYTTLDTISDHQAFCLYSPKGNVTGEVIFVNHGRPVDYLKIQQLLNTTESIFSGKILLVKQGRVAANEQYKYAMLMNASAMLLYPDPQDYNPTKSPTYPSSIWLPNDGVRSDSIFWNGAGDPETFGVPSNEYTFRDAFEFSEQVSIPAQPISALDALELFKMMQGVESPKNWQGGLNVIYRVGPGFKDNLKVKVVVNNVLVKKTIVNVIGTIYGVTEPDRYVIVGNKRDSIMNSGAIDTASGTAVFIELSRVFSKMMSYGWRPRRTIMFCSWGAEEYNLIGSTEWVEEYYKLLSMRAVAYININLVVTGNDTLSVAASPLLYHVLFNATKDLNLPSSGSDEELVSVYHNWVLSMPVMRNASTLVVGPNVFNDLDSLHVESTFNHGLFNRERLRLSFEDSSEPGTILKVYLESALQQIRPHVRTLDMYGSYAPFVTMAGIPALDMSFVKLNTDHKTDDEEDEPPSFFNQRRYPLRHTQYDNEKVVLEQVDPDFAYHRLITQLLAEIVQDLSDSLFLPFNLLDYAQLLKDFNFKSQHLHSLIVDNARDFISIENHQNVELTKLNMDCLGSAINNFTTEVIRFHSRQDHTNPKNPMAVRRLNDQLLLVERQFLDHRGMPTNNLKKHLILSPAETLSSISALQTDGLFPALLDELDQIIGNVYKKDIQPSIIRLQKHLPILINTIQGAAESLADFV